VLARFKQKLSVLTLLLLLSACTAVPVAPGLHYSKLARPSLVALQTWVFEGRVAVSGIKSSWSANIVWTHDHDHEQIKLSGPLGQGAVLINLTGDYVTIDRGDGRVQSSADVEQLISRELGLVVPVKFLRYWVLGMPRLDVAFNEVDNGFTQLGWLNEYTQMQAVNQEILPRKMVVTKDKIKLKLVVDQWQVGVIHER